VPPDCQTPFWNPSLYPEAVMLSPVERRNGDTEPIVTLAQLDDLDLRRAADGWHGIWRANGVAHQFWLPGAIPDAAAFYALTLPMDVYLELRAHAARRFWRSLNGRASGPDFRAFPAQRRLWYILSLRVRVEWRGGGTAGPIAKVRRGCRGAKEVGEGDPRKSKARRYVAHGTRMMRGGYRLLLHYPIQLARR